MRPAKRTVTGPLTGITEFVAVAEAGGFSEAARRLGTAKSRLSEQVAHLEQRLGVALFARSTRRLALTEAGTAYLEHCRRIVDEADRATAVAEELQREASGRLRVTTTPNIARLHIAPMLPGFWCRHPKVSVDLSIDERIVDLVASRVDLAIRFSPLSNPSTVVRRLAPVRFILCAAPSYLAAQGVPAHPGELRHHRCLSYGFETVWNEWQFVDREGTAIRVATSDHLRTDDGSVLTSAILAGCGIGLQSDVTAGGFLQAGRLLRVLPDWPVQGLDHNRSLCAVYPSNRAIPLKVRVFIDHLCAHLGDPPYWTVQQSAA